MSSLNDGAHPGIQLSPIGGLEVKCAAGAVVDGKGVVLLGFFVCRYNEAILKKNTPLRFRFGLIFIVV